MKTWFITGISSGIGAALAETLIAQGHFVIGTFRQAQQAAEFNAKFGEKAFALVLDLCDPESIQQAVETVKTQFGGIDVLVNNAGFGFAGAIEEASDAEVRQVFEANFFGTLQLTQTFLPLIRERGQGHIIQMSSHGGIKAFPGFGIYNASKFALEGMSEALAAELAPLGIKVTIVEPGPFRTGFAGKGFQEAATQIEAYQATAGVFRERIKQVDGKQEGDPIKAAEAILLVVNCENPPLRLPLGKIALGTIGSKLDSVKKDLEDWRAVAEAAVF